jgi:hypothetical protein
MGKWTTAFLLTLYAAMGCFAQSATTTESGAKPQQTYYQLSFVVRELDGDRVVTTRAYSANAGSLRRAQIRAGEKVPFESGNGIPNTTTWQQIDVGVGIDCQDFEMVGERLSMRISANVDSVAATEQKSVQRPVIRSNRWESTVLVPLNRFTVVFSSDDPFSTHRIELQLKASPLRP